MPNTIAENLTRLQNAKTAIGSAITAKGGTVGANDGLEEFASDIATIPSGGSATLIEKNITTNGTYNASSDNADGYNRVNVSVANSYTAGDEGKVVSNGALVSQTAMASEITTNGTVDTTLYNSVTVNVSSGGGNNANFVSNGDAFSYGCLESVVIPQGITTITNQSFPNTMAFNYLKTIEVPASVTSINSYAFSLGRMQNLEKVIINKPQDSISGSPWGATSATIIWTG